MIFLYWYPSSMKIRMFRCVLMACALARMARDLLQEQEIDHVPLLAVGCPARMISYFAGFARTARFIAWSSSAVLSRLTSQRRRPFLPIFIVLALSLTACTGDRAPKDESGTVITNLTDCNLPEDQGDGSFQGKWESTPISIFLDRNFYIVNEGQEASAVKRAIYTWNDWAGLKGIEVLSLQKDEESRGITRGVLFPDISDCNQASITNAFPGQVGVFRVQKGGEGKNERESCSNDSNRLLGTGIQGRTDWRIENGVISAASILVNFEEFNAPGEIEIDVESLLLHELGHVLGLLHSCNGGGGDRTTSPDCGSAPSGYLNAVMFPFLLEQEERRSLQQNDYDRINCLY